MPDKLEHFIARLFTDREFRECFLADPAAIAAREGLSADECRAVAAMPRQDLHTAARSYAYKRDGAKPRPVSWVRRMLGR